MSLLKKLKNKYQTTINRSEFVKNTAVLVSGTTIAQLLPLVITPILSRLYNAEDFGALTLFMTITIWGSYFVNGRYELAIVLPKKDDYSFNILVFSVFLAAFSSIFLFFVIWTFHQPIVSLLKAQNISNWLFFVPIVIFLLSVYNSLTYYHTKVKNFKLLAQSQVIRSGTTCLLQILLFFTNSGIIALVGGYSLGQLSGNLGMLKLIVKDKGLFKSLKKAKMWALAKRYKRFPQVQMPSTMLNRLGNELPNILINPFFGIDILGLYSFGYRLLTIPSAFIGASVSNVFLQAATDEYHKTGKSSKIYISVFKKLVLVGAPFFIILGFTAKPVFAFIFGKQWAMAGFYSQILSPLLFTRFVTSVMTSVLYVFEKHKIVFISQLLLFLITLSIFIAAHFLNWNFVLFLSVFSISLTLYYIVFCYFTWLVANKKI